jgi:hypothetical protein
MRCCEFFCDKTEEKKMPYLSEKIVLDNNDKTADLLEAQKQFPLIEIARDIDGIMIGGIKLPFPTALSDIYCTLVDIQEALLEKEAEVVPLQ